MAGKTVVIVGPTASGKTGRAVDIARELSGEIVSADSRQVYRGMDIGSGKDLCEYGDIRYHLIDIAQAGEKYNLFRYLQDFKRTISDLKERGVTPVVCGGSGMYVEHAVRGEILPKVPRNDSLRAELQEKGLDELRIILASYKSLHNTTDTDTVARAVRAIEIADYCDKHPDLIAGRNGFRQDKSLDCAVIGIDISREARRRRISHRLNERLENGMVDEVKGLLDEGVSSETLIGYGLEYKFITRYILGQCKYEDMVRELEIAIHQFAKRQMTWFRGMERRGIPIHWLPYDMNPKEFVDRVNELRMRPG